MNSMGIHINHRLPKVKLSASICFGRRVLINSRGLRGSVGPLAFFKLLEQHTQVSQFVRTQRLHHRPYEAQMIRQCGGYQVPPGISEPYQIRAPACSCWNALDETPSTEAIH